MDDVIEAVEEHLGIRLERRRPGTTAGRCDAQSAGRFLAAALASKHTVHSATEIAQLLGWKEHSIIPYARQVVRDRYWADAVAIESALLGLNRERLRQLLAGGGLPHATLDDVAAVAGRHFAVDLAPRMRPGPHRNLVAGPLQGAVYCAIVIAPIYTLLGRHEILAGFGLGGVNTFAAICRTVRDRYPDDRIHVEASLVAHLRGRARELHRQLDEPHAAAV